MAQMWPFLYVGLCEMKCLLFDKVIARSNTHIVYLVDPVLHFLKIHPHTFPQRGVSSGHPAVWLGPGIPDSGLFEPDCPACTERTLGRNMFVSLTWKRHVGKAKIKRQKQNPKTL